MSEPLSQLERRVYHYMIDFLAENTYQPSIREIARKFRIKSTKTVSDLLHALENKGFIERDESRSRGVRLLDLLRPVPRSQSRTTAASGEPSLAEDLRVHHDRSPIPSGRRRVLPEGQRQ
jgi:repressor LexA